MGYRAAILVLGLVLLALPTNADDRARFSIETEALFLTVMAEEEPPETCEYDLVWSSLPIPAFVVRKYFGSTLHADLLGPEPSGTYRDTLDPRKQHGDAFCSEADWAVYQKARFAAFDQNTGAEHVRLARTSFTPPIFDADYSIAVVIVSRSSFDRDRVSTWGQHPSSPATSFAIQPKVSISRKSSQSRTARGCFVRAKSSANPRLKEAKLSTDQDISLVLRFPDVAISQSSLEALLGRKMDRFEPPSGTTKGYAQLDIPDQHSAWSMLTVLANDLGSVMTDAVLRGDLGRPYVDVAYFFLDTDVTGSVLLPNAAIAAMGVAGFDVCISVYRTALGA